MLVRAARSNFDSLHEVTKQLLIWTFSKKQEIHCACRSYHSRSNSYRPKFSKPDFYRPKQRFNKWEHDNEIPKKTYNLQDLRPFERNFYVPHPNVVNRSESEIKEFYKKHDIQLFGNSSRMCPAPIFSFEELSLESETYNVIRNLNYSDPTPIQSLTWPIALSGLNMVGIARTGSGKTLGFALPGLIHVKHQPSAENTGPIALVISPTRELAQQTNRVFDQFARSCSFRTACVFGGVSKHMQILKLENAHICVGTPGRLIDILRDGFIDMRNCTYLVLDEADRLLDMGFEPQIRSIMNQMRPDRQILMWSATWPKDVQHLASDFLENFVGVRFGSAQLSANPNITQHVHVCDYREKRELLHKTLLEIFASEDSKTLIFTQTKAMVNELQRFLKKRGYAAEVLHGDVSQEKRDHALLMFRLGKTQILVGTLVVSRGIDISDIKHVIIYDFPNSVEDYVHIIGRTGRCENEGHSHTFFTPQDARFTNDLIKLLKVANQEINPELFSVGNASPTGYRNEFRR